MSLIDNLERLLASGRDDALLRFSLGGACLKEQRFADAVAHLEQAVARDPDYSAAWKLLGKALAASDETQRAAQAYRSGIAAAEKKGDVQAAREMRVFLRRLEK